MRKYLTTMAICLAGCGASKTPANVPDVGNSPSDAALVADVGQDVAQSPADATPGVDAGGPEAGATDAGLVDAGGPDAGSADAVDAGYPSIAATLAVHATACDLGFVAQPMPWTARPASDATCYLPVSQEVPQNGTWLPCPPWEWCDKGFDAPPFSPPPYKLTGSLHCKRTCETTDTACPPATTCEPYQLQDGDMWETKHVCSGNAPGSWPKYPLGGAYPAEGGLACWTPMATLATYVSGVHLARVGAHVYVLTANSFVFPAGKYHSDARLWHAPLQAPSEATMTVVFDQPDTAPEWTALAASDGRLVAFQRKTPTLGQPPAGSPWLVLAGTPDANGNVTLQPTGVQVPMPIERAHVVPGTSHACVARLDGVQPVLTCVRFDAQDLAHADEHPLQVPAQVLANVKCLNQQVAHLTDAPLRSIAVGGGRIALLTQGCQPQDPAVLQWAPFDVATDERTGPWQALVLPVPLSTFTSLLLYGDTLVAVGWSTRWTKQGLGDWQATTLLTQPGIVKQIIADDLILAVRSPNSGPGLVPASLTVNRILW